MSLAPWPQSFASKKRGDGCPHCAVGRVDETEHGVRFFEGSISDGYLQRVAPTPGYCVVVFSDRHVGDLHELTAEEHALFWSEIGAISKAIYEVFAPIHLNFQVLGNHDPHVHCHIVARYDPRLRHGRYPKQPGERVDPFPKESLWTSSTNCGGGSELARSSTEQSRLLAWISAVWPLPAVRIASMSNADDLNDEVVEDWVHDSVLAAASAMAPNQLVGERRSDLVRVLCEWAEHEVDPPTQLTPAAC